MKKAIVILSLVALGGWALLKNKGADTTEETEAQKQARLKAEADAKAKADAEAANYFPLKQWGIDETDAYKFNDMVMRYKLQSMDKGTYWETLVPFNEPAQVYEGYGTIPALKIPSGTRFKAVLGKYKQGAPVVVYTGLTGTTWFPILLSNVKPVTDTTQTGGGGTGGGSTTNDSGTATGTGGGGGVSISGRKSFFMRK